MSAPKPLPNRSSDAGPDPTPAPHSPLWIIDDHVTSARDALYEFNHWNCADAVREKARKRRLLRRAVEQSVAALEAWDTKYGPRDFTISGVHVCNLQTGSAVFIWEAPKEVYVVNNSECPCLACSSDRRLAAWMADPPEDPK